VTVSGRPEKYRLLGSVAGAAVVASAMLPRWARKGAHRKDIPRRVTAIGHSGGVSKTIEAFDSLDSGTVRVEEHEAVPWSRSVDAERESEDGPLHSLVSRSIMTLVDRILPKLRTVSALPLVRIAYSWQRANSVSSLAEDERPRT
jgi:hypothetical protein